MHVSIRIKEHLDQDWQEWLEGLQIVHEPDGTSRLLGLLQDQPALYGVLNKISRLSLALLSLESSEAARYTSNMLCIQKENSMRKIIVSEYVTLDGVMEDPGGAEGFKHGGWSFGFGGEEQQQYKFNELFATDALLLGRRTYQGFAAAWPNMPGTGAYGERMNSLPKYVVSTTLSEVTWNATLIKGDLAEELSRLKQEAGQDMLIFGSGELVRTLHERDLIDEYRLMVFPVVLGSGKRLFPGGNEKKVFKLVEAKTLGSGVVLLTYQPERKE